MIILVQWDFSKNQRWEEFVRGILGLHVASRIPSLRRRVIESAKITNVRDMEPRLGEAICMNEGSSAAQRDRLRGN